MCAAFAEAARAPRGLDALAQLMRYATLVMNDVPLDVFRATIHEVLVPEAEDSAARSPRLDRESGRSRRSTLRWRRGTRSPWLHNRPIVESFYGGAAGVAERIEQARIARKRFAETGTVDYVKAASNDDATAAMHWEGDALDYYLNPARGAIPQWAGRFAVMAWTEWLEFDPIAMASQLKVPTRLVSGEQTATPGGAKQFASGMTAPHDLVSLEGPQFDFYDNPKTVTAATASAIEHFRRTL
jgi:hypothetical protein